MEPSVFNFFNWVFAGFGIGIGIYVIDLILDFIISFFEGHED